VAGDVGVEVEHDKRMRAAMKHEIGLILIGIRGDAAEDAALRL
jgi:hypothetical protein